MDPDSFNFAHTIKCALSSIILCWMAKCTHQTVLRNTYYKIQSYGVKWWAYCPLAVDIDKPWFTNKIINFWSLNLRNRIGTASLGLCLDHLLLPWSMMLAGNISHGRINEMVPILSLQVHIYYSWDFLDLWTWVFIYKFVDTGLQSKFMI